MQDQIIDQVRQFNRFYTRQMGILNEKFLDGPLTLPELRVLFEAAASDGITVSDLVNRLRMDQGYVSRLVAGLKKQQLLQMQPDPDDGRRKQLRLTDQGGTLYRTLELKMCQILEEQLTPLSSLQQTHLVQSMQQITHLLQEHSETEICIRPVRTGELGLIAQRHAVLYEQEQGWGKGFELAVMQVMSDYLSQTHSERQQAWVAEVDGAFAGCIFAVQEDDTSARLRALLVEPDYRNLGLGRLLIEQCLTFCKEKEYRKVVLWTCDALQQARKLYRHYGFQCLRQWPEQDFGKNLNSEHWELYFY